MKIETYLKTILILLTGSIFLQNCGPDEPPRPDYCEIHWTLNHDYIDNLLFDYKTTDTLLYKRTINNEVKDTIVFVKQKSYHDTLRFHNGDVDADPNCSSSKKEFTRERIGWDYSSQYDSIFFNVQVLASGEGNGNDDLMIMIKDKLHVYNLLGASIGNYGVDFYPTYKTSEKTYNFTWDSPCVTSNQLTSSGQFYHSNRQITNWYYFYNIDYGIIEISKTDRTEVWELIR